MNQLGMREVFKLIKEERQYQDEKWNPNTTTSGGVHSYTEWIAYMEDYLAEAKHILARNAKQRTYFKVGCIMRKVGAMAVAAMEQNGAPSRKAEEKDKQWEKEAK